MIFVTLVEIEFKTFVKPNITLSVLPRVGENMIIDDRTLIITQIAHVLNENMQQSIVIYLKYK